MCLLVNQFADVKFDDDFLAGVYRLNGDGIGVMYSENNILQIKRFLPNTEKDFIRFYREEIEGRDCAWHARMRTHGEIDLTNCHPYEVLGEKDGYPIYLAHNGMLHTGNKADTSKSDTWHYIRDYLRPMLEKNPEYFLHPSFEEFVSEHIGSNRFILMDAFGNRVVVNESQGVVHNGAWLSNTYAWDTRGTRFDIVSRFPGTPSYKSPYKPSQRSYGTYGGWGVGYEDEEDEVEVENVQTKSPFQFDQETEFASELFEVMRGLEMDDSDLSWDQAENYYHKVGDEMAWDFIDSILVGAYTEAEIKAEVWSYFKAESLAA